MAEDKDSKPDKISVFSTVYADLVSTTMTLGAGAAAGSMVVNKHFFKNSEKEGHFRPIREVRDVSLEKLTERKLVGAELKRETKVIKDKYYKDIADKLKEMEIGGVIDRFGYLGKHQQTEVLLTVGAVAAGAIIGIGSIISGREALFKQKQLKEKLDSLESKKSPLNQAR